MITSAATTDFSHHPRQSDLLAIINNPARVSEKDLKGAHRLMKKWFARGYATWLEHNR